MNKANEYREEFQKQGYIILRGFFCEDEINTLMEDIKTTEIKEDGQHVLNKGTLNFYSNLFSRSKKIQEFVSQPKLVDFLKQVIGPEFWIRWDQAVVKGPGAVTFPWHQDNAYSGLKDLHYQLWIALTKMTHENGGLWLVPGSHKHFLPHKMIDKHAVYQGEPENPVFIEGKPGDVVLFSSLTLHSTTPNTSQDYRWAYVVEYMSLDHFDPTINPPYFIVAQDGKLQPEFVNSYRGKDNVINQLKYLPRSIGKLAPEKLKNIVLRRG